MRIWDQELLLNRKGGIVTDGLTFWIDGQDSVLSNESGTFLYDRVSAGYVNANPYRCAISNSGSHYVVNRNAANGRMEISANVSYANTKTYEVVFEQAATNQALIWLGGNTISGTGTSYNPCYVLRNSVRIKTTKYGNSTYGEVFTFPEVQKQMFVFAFRFNSDSTFDVFINGENVLSDSGEKRGGSLSHMFAISSNASGAAGVTNLGAYRLYNRALTEREIRKNYNFEKSIGRITN